MILNFECWVLGFLKPIPYFEYWVMGFYHSPYNKHRRHNCLDKLIAKILSKLVKMILNFECWDFSNQ